MPVHHAILDEIRRDGFNVGTHATVDVLTGQMMYHADARHPQTLELWSVNAPDQHTAVCELATLLGWDLE